MKEEREVLESLPGDLGRIAEVAGLDAAVKIALAFRGTYLYVPGLDDFMRRVRDEKIRRECDRGAPVRAMAIRHGLTERHVWRILTAPPSDSHPLVERLLEESFKQ